MIDLHTHSIFSDGALIPSELARRAQVLGIEAMAITDHADASNLDFIIPRIVAVSEELNAVNEITVRPGIELTHVPPAHIAGLVEKARSLGAKIIVVHGETIAEPVAPGTNQAALRADIDILAHPGLITEEDVDLAVGKGIFLEISARKGHSLTNGHVAGLAIKHGAKMILNTDSHEPSDLITGEFARQVALGAGLSARDFDRMQENARSLL
jgi:histidinol phosphatase-like PHP family hydrolase